MKDLLLLASAIAAALGVVGASIGPGHDTMTFVSPPEEVVEQFVRKLAGARYRMAMSHLDADTQAARERVRQASDDLRARAGKISQVSGEVITVDGDTAAASAKISTERAGELTMEFRLFRRAGSWKIAYF
jgi:hypothetical protein